MAIARHCLFLTCSCCVAFCLVLMGSYYQLFKISLSAPDSSRPCHRSTELFKSKNLFREIDLALTGELLEYSCMHKGSVFCYVSLCSLVTSLIKYFMILYLRSEPF